MMSFASLQSLHFQRCTEYSKYQIVDKAREEEKPLWNAVLETYKKAALDKEFALTQARMAYILRKEQWRGLDEYPKMWKPV